MAGREELRNWVYEAVRSNGGKASIVTVAKHIWEHHEAELRTSGDLFYKWQYEMRWAAQQLRNSKKMTFAGKDWALVA
ncbi:hypothetical protein [Parvibaculum lavamentivorans]|uniref:hypothetical protein n=1 Tax=Parvibaculum lavamentivorans TaxID=256618 RepID=UPI000A05356B|nr:hypothetical protein [Parvibaculum lavamentivorans]